jgi:iron(III) transport system permease protein
MSKTDVLVAADDKHALGEPMGREEPRRSAVLAFLRRRAGSASWYTIAVVIALFVGAPILIYFVQAFSDGAKGIKGLLSLPNLGGILLNTVMIASGATVIAALLAVILAKAVLHIPKRFRGVASLVPLLSLVAPPIATVIGWVFIFSPTVGYGNVLLRQLPWFQGITEGPLNIYSMPAIILITGLDLTGVIFLLVSTRLMEIRGPLEAAARLAGANGIKAFITVTLPLLRPSLISGAVIVFLLGLGQFTAPLLLGSRHGIDVITTKIFQLRETYPVDYATTAAIGLPLMIMGVLAVFIQRFAIGDQRKYVTQSGAGSGVPEKTSWWALVVVVLYGLVAVLGPLTAVFLVSISPFWSGDLSSVQFTLEHFAKTLSDPGVGGSVLTTLVTSLIAIAISLPIGFIAALGTTGPFRAPRWVQIILDLTFQAPLSVPRAIIGLIVLFVFLRPPFSLYGTIWMFVIGYIFIVLPFSHRSMQGSLLGLNASLFEASRITGAGYFRTILNIALPLSGRGMASGAALMLVLLSHDFAVSVMVRSPGTQVMGTKLYEFWENGVYPEVAVMSLVMTIVTAVVLAITLAIGGRSALRTL